MAFCNLNIYADDLTWEYPWSDHDLSVSGVVQLGIRSRYQLFVENGGGVRNPIDDVLNPEFRTFFTIPNDFLLVKQLSQLYVEETLLELGLDQSACDFLAPKISEFAMEVEQRRIAGEAELQGCATVAQVYIEKTDVIQREEISKIASNLNECGMCNINVDDPAFLKSGISDFMAEIDNSLSLCF